MAEADSIGEISGVVDASVVGKVGGAVGAGDPASLLAEDVTSGCGARLEGRPDSAGDGVAAGTGVTRADLTSSLVVTAVGARSGTVCAGGGAGISLDGAASVAGVEASREVMVTKMIRIDPTIITHAAATAIVTAWRRVSQARIG